MSNIWGESEALKKLGTRIKAQRLRRNLRQDQVAHAIGVSRQTYSKIELGNGTIEFRYIAKVLGFLGFDKALGELVPDSGFELTLKELLRPERIRARRRGKLARVISRAPSAEKSK